MGVGRAVGHSLPRFARLLGEGCRSWAYTRLGHQVERLRCTRLRHRTCKTSGSSQKKGLLPMGFSIFFLKIPPILKIEVGFFSDRKTFAQNDFPGKFYYFGTNYERSFKRFAEPFFSQKTPDFRN